MEQNQNQLPVQNKKVRLVGVTAIGTASILALSNANAALTLDTGGFLTDISTAESFGIAIGIAILGFVAVLALVKKSRGSVK